MPLSSVTSIDSKRPRLYDEIGPYTIVPEWIVDSVSVGPLALYVVLALHANKEQRAWPSRKTLAERLGVSVNTIDRWKTELAEAGCIKVRNRSKNGVKKSNVYQVLRVQRGTPMGEGT